MRKLIAFAAIISLFAVSCRTPRYVYSPSLPNVPYFEEKGETKLSAYYAGTGKGDQGTGLHSGYDVQGAYAISDNWALTAGLFKRKERDTYWLFVQDSYNIFDSSVVNYKRNLVELGGGYFTPVNRGETIFFNVYSGVGFGKFSIDDKGFNAGAAYSRKHTNKILKWYIQPGVNFMTSEYFRFSLVSRISFVHYSRSATNYTTDELAYFRLNKINDGWLSFFEPTLNIQAGVPGCDWLRLEAGLTLSTDPEDNYLEARSFCPFIGLSFDLSKTRIKKASTTLQ